MISIFSYLVSKQAPSVSLWDVGTCPSSTIPNVPSLLSQQQLHHHQISHTFNATLNVACLLLPSLFLDDIWRSMWYSLHLFYVLSYFCLYRMKFKYIPHCFLCTRNAHVYFFLPTLSHSALCQLSENRNTRNASQVSKTWPLRLLSTCFYLYVL